MSITVSGLIKLLQEVPNQDAVVTVNDTAGANLTDADNVVVAGASGTFPLDATEAEFGSGGGAYSAGTVVLTGEA